MLVFLLPLLLMMMLMVCCVIIVMANSSRAKSLPCPVGVDMQPALVGHHTIESKAVHDT